MTTIFRIQDRSGRGPWKLGFSKVWVQDRPDHDLLRPWYEQFGWVQRSAITGMHVGCGCRTVDTLRRWFTRDEYAKLLGHGYHAVELDVGRILGESAIQVVFERARPLREAARPFDLYASVAC